MLIMSNTPLEVANDLRDKKHLTRHFDLISGDGLKKPITVIGAGGIGSWVTFALAKMGFEHIRVYDPDKVAIENVGNQLYGISDIGKYKVEALREICLNVGCEIKTVPMLFSPLDACAVEGIVVLAVDSMKARAEITADLCEDVVMIDGRMGAEKILLYTAFDEPTRDIYAKSLYSDDEAEKTPCTAKATSYCALTIAGLIVGQIKSFIQGQQTIKNMSMDAASGASIRFAHAAIQ